MCLKFCLCHPVGCTHVPESTFKFAPVEKINDECQVSMERLPQQQDELRKEPETTEASCLNVYIRILDSFIQLSWKQISNIIS